MTAFLLVGLGGALGSMTRYGVGLALPSAGFPYATLAVNVIGCFCIGLAMPSLARTDAPELRLLVVVGFLGGFTTFSAFGSETVALMRAGRGIGLPILNIVANVGLGLTAVVIGRTVGS